MSKAGKYNVYKSGRMLIYVAIQEYGIHEDKYGTSVRLAFAMGSLHSLKGY